MQVDTQASASNHRRETREPRQAVLITPIIGNHTTQMELVDLVNVSLHGVCIRARRPFSLGSDLVLKTDADSEIVLVYSVRFCGGSEGAYEVGGEYVASMGGRTKLDAPAAHALLCEASAASAALAA
jgi:hypothetical protein